TRESRTVTLGSPRRTNQQFPVTGLGPPQPEPGLPAGRRLLQRALLQSSLHLPPPIEKRQQAPDAQSLRRVAAREVACSDRHPSPLPSNVRGRLSWREL